MTPAPGVRETSHTGHDPMLVAALAAGDLAGDDRDQAIALTTSCADCATLRDDLVALARATAAVPPPFSAPQRDYRLTHADAARLRPTVWRLVGAVSSPRPATTRRAGLAFTTLGLVGLLVGNVQLSFGSFGSSSAAASVANAPAAPDTTKELVQGNPPDSGSGRTSSEGAALGAAASSAPALEPLSSGTYATGAASAPPRSVQHDQASPGVRGGAVGAGDSSTTDAGPTQGTQSNESSASTLAATTEPSRPWNVLFAAAVVIGLVLLGGARIRSRRGV